MKRLISGPVRTGQLRDSLRRLERQTAKGTRLVDVLRNAEKAYRLSTLLAIWDDREQPIN